jgi:hypothetical protein
LGTSGNESPKPPTVLAAQPYKEFLDLLQYSLSINKKHPSHAEYPHTKIFHGGSGTQEADVDVTEG